MRTRISQCITMRLMCCLCLILILAPPANSGRNSIKPPGTYTHDEYLRFLDRKINGIKSGMITIFLEDNGAAKLHEAELEKFVYLVNYHVGILMYGEKDKP
jgi:hypothetical protein